MVVDNRVRYQIGNHARTSRPLIDERSVCDGHSRQTAADLLRKVGLGERLQHYPAQLSGGEQQRVALARAFLNQPKILFADEPTGNLDAETSDRIVDLLFGLNGSSGTALVLVTHNFDLARKTGRIIQLKGKNISRAVAAFAREYKITQIIFGRSAVHGWQQYLYLNAIQRFLRNAPAGSPTGGFGNPGAVAYDPKRDEILVPN